MDRVEVKGIELLAARNQAELLAFLLNEQGVKTGKLVAINAEKVILSEEQPDVRQLLAKAEYNYADGISVVWTIHKKYPQFADLERIAGADLWLALMQQSANLGTPVFLVGGQADVLAETFTKLNTMGVNVVGTQDGYFSLDQEITIFEQIKQSGAKIISVALGSPKQEQFMQKAQVYYPDALYMGVGGSYDVFVGKVKRAPKCWQNAGLEWLYRLLKQPTRWQRQCRLIKYAYHYWRNQL
ncbi:lipopolysaccharide N-acetylmannosaminouronosyltransferase [Pasteurellaceae bacterium Orientalotternb1]|nr:lipopolysaccharide N-acetylmannosaminouronosyltransferase [Pasteurellaceae bacterium Orientalotternb1]